MLGGMSKRMESAAAAPWREIVRGQADSGLSVAAYCRRARVPQSSFYAWRRKLRAAGTFAAVRVTPEPDAVDDHGALELHLRRGRRVTVRPGFDRDDQAAGSERLRGRERLVRSTTARMAVARARLTDCSAVRKLLG